MAVESPKSLDEIRDSTRKQQQSAMLKDLNNLVSPDFAAAWKKIGIQLSMPLGILNSIEAGYPSNVFWCCDQMLENWIDIEPAPLWGKMIKAIDSPAVTAYMSSFSDSKPISENKMSKAISLLACQLQVKAIKSRFKTIDDDWPLKQPKHFTDLVFVYHKTGKVKKEEIELVAGIQHRGRISSTNLAFKDPNAKCISDIFTPISTKEGPIKLPEKILIEGAPGIGKTTLVKEITFRWANGTLLVNKKLVILVYLRDPKAQRVHTLEDFVRCFCSRTDETIVVDYMRNTKGKDMAIILDGYDELPEKLMSDQDSFFKNLINQNVDDLLNCMVIITSRQTESTRLNDVVDRRIEVMGFTDENRKQYIAEALNNEKDKIKHLLEYLDKNPAINAYCYVPLNMTILLHLYTGLETITKMPKTQMQIYKTFICIIIAWFIKKKEKLKYCSISDFSEIPASYQDAFKSICKLAFVALRENKVVLTSKEIDMLSDKSLELSENYGGLGLLKAVKFLSIKENCPEISFSFLHLSVQEILAAYHITLLRTHKQLQLLHESFWKTKYHNMWIMYVGLTEGQSFELRHFLSPYRFQIFTRLSIMLPGIPKQLIISKKITEDKMKCLYLFQCFSETERDDMNQPLGEFLKNGEIDVSSQILSAVNIHTLGLFLARSKVSKWKVLNLSGCCIQNNEIKRLHNSFIHNCYKRNMIHIDSVNVANNSLTNDSIPVMLELILSWNIQSIDISSNNININNLIDVIIDRAKTVKLDIPMVLKVVDNNYSMVVGCNIAYNSLAKAIKSCSCVCIVKCQIEMNTNEFLSSALQRGKDIYLYRNELPLHNIIMTVMVKEFSSFHYMEEDFDSIEIKSIITKLIPSTKFAFQINTTFPLHVYDVTPCNIITVKNGLKQKNMSGTFLFKGCVVGHVHEIVSSVPFDTDIKLFHLTDYSAAVNIDPFVSKLYDYSFQESDVKKIMSLLNRRKLKHLDMSLTSITGKAVKEISKVISSNYTLEYLNLCNCKIPKKDIQILCDSIKSNTAFSNFILSNSHLTDQAAFSISETFSRSKDLKHIELANCNLSNKGLQSILSSTKENTALQTIDFSLNNIADEDAHSIAAILSNNNSLECIHLQDCSLSNDALNNITKAASSLTLLKSLDFSCNTISSESALMISILIKKNPGLEYLNLSESMLSEKGLDEIVLALANSQNIKVVNLNGNKITDPVATNLGMMIANNQGFNKLFISNCHLQSTGFTKISESLQSFNSLTHLDVSYNSLNDFMACNLAEIIAKNTKLCYIDLSCCELQEIGFIVVLEALKKAKNCKHIDLKFNKLVSSTTSDNLAKSIANNVQLEYLSLRNCNLADHNLAKLLKFVNHSLTYLDISFNKFTSVVMPKLIHVISTNHNLHHVNFSNCSFGEDTLNQLCEALKEVKNLKFIDLSGFCINHETAKSLTATIITNYNLETLILSDCQMQHKTTTSLLDVLEKISSLKTLDLSSNHLSTEGVTKLASVIGSNSIEYLNLSRCKLQNSDVSVLSHSIMENSILELVDLSINNLSDEIASSLSVMFAANTRLKKVNLAGNNFTTDGIETIINGLNKTTYLKEINLSSYQFTNKLTEAVNVMMRQNSQIKHLDFKEFIWQRNDLTSLTSICNSFSALQHVCISNVNLHEENATIVTTLIYNNQEIQSFCLNHCTIADSEKVKIFGSLLMVKSLKRLILESITIVKEIENLVATVVSNNIDLKELTLSKCDMQCTAVVAIAQGLKNHHNLTHLNVNHTMLTDHSISKLSTSLADLTSLESLSLSGCTAKVDAKEFSKMIPRTRLKHLDLSNNQILSSEADLIAMFIVKNVHLQHLNLSNCKLQSNGIEIIIEQLKKLTSLKHLDLSENTLTDKAANDISCLVHNNIGIRVVCLSNSPLEYDALKTSASLRFEENKRKNEFMAVKVHSHKLEYVRLRGQDWKGSWLKDHTKTQLLTMTFSQKSVPEEAFISILKFLKENNQVQHLELAITDMDKNKSQSLFEVLNSTKALKCLNISYSDIPVDIAHTFVEAIKLNNELEKLYLHDCRINKHVIEKVALTLKTITTLKCLDLYNVKINDKATELADVITSNLAIEYLNLSSCKLFEKDVKIIAASMQQLTSVKHLNLSFNDISHAAQELAIALGKNMEIEHLNLSNCKLREREISAIGKELCNMDTLKELDLGSNEIINEAADVIASVIQSNTTLKKITLRNCNLTEPDDEKIFQALKVITSLEYIDLSCNAMHSLQCYDLQVVLTSNRNLTYLNLSKCKLMRTEIAEIQRIKQSRKKLFIKL